MNSFQWIGTEPRNNSLDVVSQNGKRRKKTIASKDFGLAERYIGGDTQMLIRFVTSFDRADYISCFQCWDERDVKPLSPRAKIESPCACLDGDRENQLVLVNSVKLMDPKEQIVTSTVWTKRIDKVLGLFGHSLCFSARFGFIDFFTLANWKVDLGIRDSYATES